MDNSLLTAVVGAGSALFGVVVSQVFALLQTRLNEKRARRQFLRQKYEELAVEVNAVAIGLAFLLSADDTAQATSQKNLSSARHCRMLSLIYFPLLIPHTKLLFDLSVRFDSIRFTPSDNKIQFIELAKDIGKALDELDKALQDNAGKYT